MQIYTNIFFFNKKIREGHPAMVNVCFRPWWDGSGTSQSGVEWSHFNNHNESDKIKIKYKETRQW